MADIEIDMGKVTWRDFVGEASWMLLVISASWGLNLQSWNLPAAIVYMVAVWLPLTYVLMHYVMMGAKWKKLHDGLVKGAKAAREEYLRGREIAKGVTELLNEQNRK